MKTLNLSNTIGLKILDLKNQTTPAVKFKNEQWITSSGTEYYSTIESIAFSLSALGVKKLTPVAIMAQTQFKWAATDLACLGLGSLVVSVYPNNTPTDVEFILQHSESSILFIENEAVLNSLSEVIHRCKDLQWIVLFSGSSQSKNTLSWDSFLEKGQKLKIENPEIFKTSCSSLTLNDPATIIYTSGTTGAPKGVLLSHEQITSEVEEAFSLFGVKSTDVSLSFLPYSHILGRVDHWAGIYFKYLVCFAESIEKIKQNLAEIQPTFFISVPRIFEKIYSAISAQLESDQLQKYIFNWAQNVGQKNIDHRLSSQNLSFPLYAQSFLAEKLVFQRVKKFFGGKLRFAISGGAPLSPSIGNFFLKNGILILEGYGLTETTAAITVNPPFNYQMGTAGLPIGDVQIKIADDGEILIKSKKVMLEYYKNPQQTSEVLKNSWFATGDIGHILPSGHLQITDRKKDLIKTGGGKYVAPQKLENIFKTYPLISYSIIHGDQRKYITALFTLDKENLIKFGQNQNLDFNSWQDLIDKRQIFDEVRRIVADVNSQLASYESIKKFKILAIEFSVEGGELTPSLKVKRRALEKKYMNWLNELYS
ncbi:MAG TPA: long-chain fatty acid--CoA ligase [Pseudobdellovibrionaceae bacterium]|nr:long-chain fatty acid--CoA ligase [Pseudobdellovibrionaceae bacterium]